MASAQTRPEPMNASPHHSKVKVSMTLADPIFVAGTHVTGKMEVECRADKGLGIGVIMVELFATQELTSRDHSATSTFLHSRRLFQGPGLPPSNAVQAHPLPGDPPLPPTYHQARRGVSTFLFRIPIPASAPSSISFGSDLARIRYEVRASAGVFWKGEKRLVTNKRGLDVVESYEEDFSRVEPQGVIVGEHGKIWVQGRIVGGIVVAGESACVELQVKNHSSKKNTGLTLTLTRTLILPGINSLEKSPLQISDVLTAVPFRGPEYIIPPGAEGIASLVFDVPSHARGVRGGALEGDEPEGRTSESLFEIRCVVGIKMSMGIGSKDIHLDLPVTIVHPAALPEPPPPEQYAPPAVCPYPGPVSTPAPYLDRSRSPYPALPMSPPIPAYIDQAHVWIPAPVSNVPHPYQYYSPPIEGQQYYFPPPPTMPISIPPRSLSVGHPSDAQMSGSPPEPQQYLLPLDTQQSAEPEVGKGERASRVTHHLRLSSRHRSVSPQSHRFPVPASHPLPILPPAKPALHLRNLPSPPRIFTDNLSVASQDAVVHSPRPFLSPKHSYTVDPIASTSTSKSERVEELERMAAEVGATTNDFSADIPKASSQSVLDEASNLNKTLPTPPLPTRKERHATPPPERTRVDTYFATDTVPEPDSLPIPLNKTPPTPTLTAVTPAGRLKADHPSGLGGESESGLDALERRLLAEVGTRKLDSNEKRPDVRSIVLPITIPTKTKDPEPLNDSAISSLTLGAEHDHDSDEKTHRAGKSSASGDERVVDVHQHQHLDHHQKHDDHRGKGETEGKVGKDREKRSGKRKEKARDSDGPRMRKSAKGRVAAWLGEIDPKIPPSEDVVPPSPTVIKRPDPTSSYKPQVTAFAVGALPGAVDRGIESGIEKSIEKDEISSAPNPRSSGFVPIGTLKREIFQRRPATKEMSVAEEARRVTDIWSSSPVTKDKLPVLRPVATPTHIARSIKTDRGVSPPSSEPSTTADVPRNVDAPEWAPKHSDTIPQPVAPSPKKITRAPPFPPVLPVAGSNSGAKYDIRSARGGRGGKVTAVASIWASGGAGAGPKSQDIRKRSPVRELSSPAKHLQAPIKPISSAGSSPGAEPKLVGLAGKRPRPVIKSSSVPAIISSSHATPTLSSTASLARPTSASNNARPPFRVQTTIAESSFDARSDQFSMKAAFAKPTTSGGDLAFGQARLRDLIKKYQGQSA